MKQCPTCGTDMMVWRRNSDSIVWHCCYCELKARYDDMECPCDVCVGMREDDANRQRHQERKMKKNA